MNLKLFSIVLGLGVALSSSLEPVLAHANAAVTVKSTDSKATAKKKTGHKSARNLQTNVKFDDSVLHGQYQTPDEALVKVENEKGLSDLIGVRKHFKDRLATSSEQE